VFPVRVERPLHCRLKAGGGADQMIAAADDILRQRFRAKARGDAVELGLRRAGVGDERGVEALGGAIVTLLRDLEERFQARQLGGRSAQFGAEALKAALEAVLLPAIDTGDAFYQFGADGHGPLGGGGGCWRAVI
jgi:hypothetical protein